MTGKAATLETQAGSPAASDRTTRPHAGPRSALTTFVFAVLACVWFASTGYRTDVGLLFLVYSLIALGFYIPFVWGGSLSVAYNAYFGIGAYAVAIWAARTDLPVVLAIPIGMLIAAVTAAILGYVTRGLSGFYLAMITLLFARAFQQWIGSARSLTGGGAGLGDIPRPEFLGWEMGRVALVVTGVVVVWALLWVVARMQTGLFGLALRARREVKVAVDAFGVNTTNLDVVTLALGAAIASIAGVFFALVNQFVLADNFDVHLIFTILFIPLVGGRGRPWGVAIGSAVVLMLTMTLSWLSGTSLGNLTYGLGVLLVLLFAPEGLYGLGTTVRRLFRGRRDHTEVVS